MWIVTGGDFFVFLVGGFAKVNDFVKVAVGFLKVVVVGLVKVVVARLVKVLAARLVKVVVVGLVKVEVAGLVKVEVVGLVKVVVVGLVKVTVDFDFFLGGAFSFGDGNFLTCAITFLSYPNKF